MNNFRLHLKIDPDAAICKNGRFLPFNASDAVPSRSWGKPLPDEHDPSGSARSQSLFKKRTRDQQEWREDTELGNPTGVRPGDHIEIVIITTRPVYEVKLTVIFARAPHAEADQRSTPIAVGDSPRCVFDQFEPGVTGVSWWRFMLPSVAAFPSARRFYHYEFTVAALCKVNQGDADYLHLGHDPEVIVDMSSE